MDRKLKIETIFAMGFSSLITLNRPLLEAPPPHNWICYGPKRYTKNEPGAGNKADVLILQRFIFGAKRIFQQIHKGNLNLLKE